MKVKRTTNLKSQIKRSATTKEKKEKGNVLWLPSGSVVLNIRCSGMWDGAYRQGRFINVIGDSHSGKTILVMTGLAQMSIMPKFDHFRLIYDDAEEADSFDHEKMFGKKFAERIEPPNFDPDTNEPIYSETIEQFFDNVSEACDYAIKNKKPFVYVLDSFDSIDADAEVKKEDQNRAHRKAGNDSKVKGSFQATKQKKASQMFRQLKTKLKKAGGVVIIISQTRDNLTAGSFEKKYRSGGKALKFYSSIEMWLAYIGAITKTIDGIKYTNGTDTLAKISKNKFTGQKSECEFPIYPSYGIDDVGACIDFLVKIKYWHKPAKGTKIKAPEFKHDGTKKALIAKIEKDRKKLEKKLFKLTEKAVKQLNAKLVLDRKPKFG